MKQILQHMSSGETELVEAPAPGVGYGKLKLYTTASLISAGTERMLVSFGKASLLDKARQQPDRVRMVMEKVKTDGLLTTVEAVRSYSRHSGLTVLESDTYMPGATSPMILAAACSCAGLA